MLKIKLPAIDGAGNATIEEYRLTSADTPESNAPRAGGFRSRVAYAAAHVVANPLTDTPDWESTMAFRRHLWSLGFSVAEAMDTAQRGMGLDWPTAQELISRSLADARAEGRADAIACGAGTDQLAPDAARSLDDVEKAYEEQVAFVEDRGGRVILMASRALARIARSADDYARVYGRILSQVKSPVILHWLGDMFDPQLAGYWGETDLDAAMDRCLGIIGANPEKVAGIKISLLDAEKEIAMRRRLPNGVRMLTGDDFNYDRLILGDDQGHSDALLGIFDPIAVPAAAALEALDQGRTDRYRALMEPTVPLSRHIFKAPTYCYKTGVVFLAYLNGHQDHFRMIAGAESARGVLHLAELFRLADAAGVLRDPEMAVVKMKSYLAVAAGACHE